MQESCCYNCSFNFDEGLGTTYERFTLHEYFRRIDNKYAVRSVLEAPSFGITGIPGINSMWWVVHGVPVTIVDDNPERLELVRKLWGKMHLEVNLVLGKEDTPLPLKQKSFDLGWNFCALEHVRDISKFFEELTRVTRKAIFICIPNTSGLSRLVRHGLEKHQRREFIAENNSTVKIQTIMNRLGWNCMDRGYFDVPPWPDIAMKKEEFLKKLGLGWLSGMLMKRDREGISILDYFSGKRKDMEKEILKYGFLENSPIIFKRFWAHHQYLIFVPR